MRTFSTLSFSALFLVLAGFGNAQETFVLQAPGDPPITSSAFLHGRSLTIRDETGRTFDYVRQPEMDSRDGKFIGFYSNDALQFLRFPAAGKGSMYVGTMRGSNLSWRQSRMQVFPRDQVRARPETTAGAPPPLRYGGGPSVVPEREVITTSPPVIPHAHRRHSHPPFHVSAFHDGRRTAAGFIDNDGRLELYRQQADDWSPVPFRNEIRLPPAAPFSIAPDAKDDLAAYAISPRGDLVSASFGGAAGKFRSDTPTKFPTGGHVATLNRGKGTASVFAIDNKGIIWEGDAKTSRMTPIISHEGIFPPGAPISAVRGVADEIYLVGNSGDMTRLERGVRGWSAESIGRGYAPGGELAAAFDTSEDAYGGKTIVAAVDRTNSLRVVRPASRGWTSNVISTNGLRAGMPVSISTVDDGLRISAVRDSGDWIAWNHQQGAWRPTTIGSGISAFGDVALLGSANRGFAVDHSGQLIASQYAGGRWGCSVCRPGLDTPVRVAAREITPNPGVKPANVRFENRHAEELLVRIYDNRASQRPIDITLAPGESRVVPLERDTGGFVTQTYFDRGVFGGVVQRVRTVPIPPAQIYDVTVYEKSISSVYFDRTTNRTNVPDEVQRSLKSIGAFPIPPGDLLPDGARIDVYREAASQRNPGAVRLFDTPR